MKNLLCYGFLFLIGNLNAQTPRYFDTNLVIGYPALKEVKVYGKGISSNYNDRTSSIQLLNILQNRDLPIRSVNEALSYVPGLDLRQRGVQVTSNFSHFLPGKHLIPFTYNKVLGSFNLIHR